MEVFSGLDIDLLIVNETGTPVIWHGSYLSVSFPLFIHPFIEGSSTKLLKLNLNGAF